MPNWVTCNISFSAPTAEEMRKFYNEMVAPRPHIKEDPEQPFRSLPYSEENIKYEDPVFSFWNIVKPGESILPEYWGPDPQLPFAQAIMHATNHWYDWNIRNWGCKWDAKVIVDDGPDGRNWDIMIDTAWSPPTEALKELAEWHPNITFTAVCVEEQGWGYVYQGLDGEFITLDDWDIPDSHEEFAQTSGKYGYDCRCVENGYDEDYLYDDCPRPASKLVDA